MSKTSVKTTVEWSTLNWRKLERAVFKLQKRIYRASQRGDHKAVRRLQKTLMRSWSAQCLAVRKVTQDNKGKNTAGVDRVKSLTPEQRIKLAENLKIDHKANALRRVYIPKPGLDEKRPLGIPTIRDRAKQALAKLALEPEWEAKFEESSYGFRPGRSAHDAIEHIFININQRPKYVLDADIAKCFDRINHTKLLRKINTFPSMRKQIKAWLKAGVMDGKQLFPTEEGTPQGGVISPLLANIALHGLIEAISSQYPTTKNVNGKQLNWKPCIIRYADDFVVFHVNEQVIHEIKEKISEWLKPLGLMLKDEKTKICHTFEPTQDQEPGFNFLGFNVKQFKDNRTRLGFKTIIQPSQQSVQKHVQNLREIIKAHQNAKTSDLIKKINPIIRGWANYYRTVCSAETFKRVHHDLYMMLTQWGRRRTKNYQRTYQLYWKECDGRITFSSDPPNGGEPMKLISHNQFSIQRHTKVKGNKSPYDADWTYWGERLRKLPGLQIRVQKLLKQQAGKCNRCGLHFQPEDKWEVDHIIPKSQGGKDSYKNLQLLHRHCHHAKTGIENQQRYAQTQCCQVIEEPDEVKVSRPVLNQR
ncbi:group II intron reverse transcriptase/maturase [Planktothrix mougeotii]|uniref:Group II intron reverse transcriptase/maturase n=1 Tax=Planktothrix mougeotii LEGE 06226 TaxID=1828728 RepID=A0ABR9UG65_9CYAN|nr:group II intron reverse transcriptase/maturase [Planktothrix mougeotii]MBE9145462.1 group II intron reverse transcriptase/maturase [Planktothrix mougeotii LEGE 06226]